MSDRLGGRVGDNLNIRAFSAGSRVAGLVVASGYLSGIVPGPVVAVVGALALISLGRALLDAGDRPPLLAASLTVISVALGVGALRWSSLDLGSIRGAQAVLGPSVVVGPAEAAAAAWIATVAALIAAAVWAGPPPSDRAGVPPRVLAVERVLWVLELAVVGMTVASVFWGPAWPGRGAGAGRMTIELGRWTVGLAVAAVPAATLAWWFGRRAAYWQWAALGAAAVGAGTGAALVASVTT